MMNWFDTRGNSPTRTRPWRPLASRVVVAVFAATAGAPFARAGLSMRFLPDQAIPVHSIAFSPDERALASGGRDKTTELLYIGLDKSAGLDRGAARDVPPKAPAPAAGDPSPHLDAGAARGGRVALVIANGAYSESALPNPAVDAGLVQASLEHVGFAVTVKKDLAPDGFEQALRDFAETARGADLAVFYYSGSGYSVLSQGREENVLRPVAAAAPDKTAPDALGDAVPLSHVESIILHRARTTLVFVDDCRNVLKVPTSLPGGLETASEDADTAEGAFVMFSTRFGKLAKDGPAGEGSPFARAFAAAAAKTGLGIEATAALIREAVRKETKGEQVPDIVRGDLPAEGVVLVKEAGR